MTALLRLDTAVEEAGPDRVLDPSWLAYAADLDGARPWPLRLQSDAQTLPVLLNRIMPAGPHTHDMAARLAHDLAGNIQTVIKLQGAAAAEITCGDARHAELFYAENSAFLFCLDPATGVWEQAAAPYGMLWAAVNLMDAEAWDAAEPPVEEFQAGEVQRLRQWQQSFHRMIAMAQQDADLSLDAQGMLVGLLAGSSAVLASLQQYTRPADSTRRRQLAGRILDDVRGLYSRAMNVTSRADAPPMLRVQLQNSMRHLPSSALRYRVVDMRTQLSPATQRARMGVMQSMLQQRSASFAIAGVRGAMPARHAAMAAVPGVRRLLPIRIEAGSRQQLLRHAVTPAALKHIAGPTSRGNSVSLQRMTAPGALAAPTRGQAHAATPAAISAIARAAVAIAPAVRAQVLTAVTQTAPRNPTPAASAMQQAAATGFVQGAAKAAVRTVAPTQAQAETRTVVDITPQALAAGVEVVRKGAPININVGGERKQTAANQASQTIKFRRPRRPKRKFGGVAAKRAVSAADTPRADQQHEKAKFEQRKAETIQAAQAVRTGERAASASTQVVIKTRVHVTNSGPMQPATAEGPAKAPSHVTAVMPPKPDEAQAVQQKFEAAERHVCGPNCAEHGHLYAQVQTEQTTDMDLLLGAGLSASKPHEKAQQDLTAAFESSAVHICGPNCAEHGHLYAQAQTEQTTDMDLLLGGGGAVGGGVAALDKKPDAKPMFDSSAVMSVCPVTGTPGCTCPKDGTVKPVKAVEKEIEKDVAATEPDLLNPPEDKKPNAEDIRRKNNISKNLKGMDHV